MGNVVSIHERCRRLYCLAGQATYEAAEAQAEARYWRTRALLAEASIAEAKARRRAMSRWARAWAEITGGGA